MAKWIPIECSGFHAAWPNGSRLNAVEIGDEKPSLFLQRLKNLAGGQCNDNVLKTLFMEQLPDNIRAVLAISEVTDLNKLASQADKVADIVKPSIMAVARAEPTSSSTNMNDRIEELTKMVQSLSKRFDKHASNQRSRSRSRSRSKNFQKRSSSRGNDSTEDGFCYYHSRFGEKSWQCKPPCTWKKAIAPKPEN